MRDVIRNSLVIVFVCLFVLTSLAISDVLAQDGEWVCGTPKLSEEKAAAMAEPELFDNYPNWHTPYYKTDHFTLRYVVDDSEAPGGAVPDIDSNDHGEGEGNYNNNNAPDYVEQTAKSLEKAWDTLTSTPYDFKKPKSNNNNIDIYIYDIDDDNIHGTSTNLTSSTTTSTLTDTDASWDQNDFSGEELNPNTSQEKTFPIKNVTDTEIEVWGDITSVASTGDNYVVYDTIAVGGQTSSGWNRIELDPFVTYGSSSIKKTSLHELFHRVQYSYDSGEGDWILEGTARWIEDAVYDSMNDYMYSFDRVGNQKFMDNPDHTLTQLSYEAVLFWKYFSEKYTDQTSPQDEPYIGVDVIREFWEKCEDWDGIKAVNKTVDGPGNDFELTFNWWAETNYTKDLGDPFPRGDYLEDEEGPGYAEVTPAHSFSVSGNTSPQEPQVKSEHVNSWATDYIEIDPDSSADVIEVDFNGYTQMTDLNEDDDFSKLQILCAQDSNKDDELDFLPYGFSSSILGKEDNNVTETFTSSGKDYCDEIMVVVTGKTAGDNYDVKVSTKKFEFNKPTTEEPVYVGPKDNPKNFEVEVEYPTSGLGSQDFEVKK